MPKVHTDLDSGLFETNGLFCSLHKVTGFHISHKRFYTSFQLYISTAACAKYKLTRPGKSGRADVFWNESDGILSIDFSGTQRRAIYTRAKNIYICITKHVSTFEIPQLTGKIPIEDFVDDVLYLNFREYEKRCREEREEGEKKKRILERTAHVGLTFGSKEEGKQKGKFDLKLKPTTLEIINMLAEKEEISRSQFVRNCITHYLQDMYPGEY